MSDLIPFTKHGITLLTRQDTYGDDRGVLDEVLTYDIGPGPFRTVLDIGAHVGAFSVWMAVNHPEAEIVAYEPDPDNCRVLRENIKPYDHVEAWENPVGYHDGNPIVVVHPSHSTCCWVVDNAKDVPSGYQTRHTADWMTLEDVLDFAEWDTLDLLKIDAEGAEENIFTRCATGTLQRIHRVCGEFHHGKDHFMNGIGARFVNLGFQVWAESDPNRHATFTAWRKS